MNIIGLGNLFLLREKYFYKWRTNRKNVKKKKRSNERKLGMKILKLTDVKETDERWVDEKKKKRAPLQKTHRAHAYEIF